MITIFQLFFMILKAKILQKSRTSLSSRKYNFLNNEEISVTVLQCYSGHLYCKAMGNYTSLDGPFKVQVGNANYSLF